MPDSWGLLAAKFEAIFPHLDERHRRLLMGAEERVLGHAGMPVVARVAGVREATVSLGPSELEGGAEPQGRARKRGGGRKRLADLNPALRPTLLVLVGKASTDGIYDLAADVGRVNVGTDHDTAVLAVESIRRWRNDAGRVAYPRARRLRGRPLTGHEVTVAAICATTTGTGLHVHEAQREADRHIARG
jgi:Rhodopirellula transposase DDE domain